MHSLCGICLSDNDVAAHGMYHGNKPAKREMAQAAMQQMAFEAVLNVSCDPDNIDNTDFADMTSAEPAGALINAAPEDMAKAFNMPVERV